MTSPLRLASASPRRAALLRTLGLDFSVHPVDVDETPPAGAPDDVVLALARRKAEAARAEAPDGSWILAADTLVFLDGAPLGKPRDAADAVATLLRLSGRAHEVRTAVVAARADAPEDAAEVAAARVEFHALPPATIHAYVATGEPLDKAGAYAIQGLSGPFVRRVEGLPSTVIGLPVDATVRVLARAGFPLPARLRLA